MDTKWDAEKLGGSIKRGIVNPDLIEERSWTAFDMDEMERFMLGEFLYKYVHEKLDLYKKHPELKQANDFDEMTRDE